MEPEFYEETPVVWFLTSRKLYQMTMTAMQKLTKDQKPPHLTLGCPGSAILTDMSTWLKWMQTTFRIRTIWLALRSSLLQNTSKEINESQLIKMILSVAPTQEELANEEFLELNQIASDLYGIIHSRYILTATGLAKVYHNLQNSVYGTCPRALCDW